MKKLQFIIQMLMLGALCAPAQPLNKRYTKERPLVMVCDWDKPPYEYLNDKGEPAGSNIDIMRAVAREIGIPIRFVMKEWSIAVKTFERGDADIIIANEHRYQKSQYIGSENTINYYRIRAAVYADSIAKLSMEVLESEGAVFKPGEFASIYLMGRDSIDKRRIEFQTPKVALMGLINGDYKYYIWGEEPLKWKIKELNLEGITLADADIPISEHHVFGRDKELMTQIDDQYSRLKQQGVIATIQDQWIHPERKIERNYHTGAYVAVVLLTLLLAALLYLLTGMARKHVISATRQSRELNEMMLQALHMGSFIVMEYDIRHDRVTNNYGHILPDEGMHLEEFINRIHPDQRQEFRQRSKALIEGRERHFELDKRWNAGTDDDLRWFNFRGHAIVELDENGHPAYIVNAIHNATQEMEEDEAARALIQKYAFLSNLPLVAMSFYNKEGFLIDLNDNMKKLCAIDRDLNAARFWDTVSIFDVPLFRNVISPSDREDVHFCQHMDYPELGIDKYIECHINPLFNADGEISNYLVIALDITENRQLTHQLYQMRREEAETRAKTALQSKQSAVMLQDCGRHIVRSDIPSQTIRFFRSSEDTCLTFTFTQLSEMLVEEDREPFLAIARSTKSREQQAIVIHFSQESGGAGLPPVVDMTLRPLTDERGQVTGHEGIATDVTDLHKMQRELRETTQRARDSVRLKNGFMASMTHELRTPLNAIIGFTSILPDISDDAERRSLLDLVHENTQKLLRIIDDVVNISSIESGQSAMVLSNFELNMTLTELIDRSRQDLKRGVEMQTQFACEHLMVTTDYNRLCEIVRHLLSNAVKFTEQGSVTVGYGEPADGHISIWVSDTGKGISEENRQRVFDRFFKVDEFVPGAGLGLSICQTMAYSMGGTVTVASKQGEGSTFTLHIPIQ